MPVVTPIATVPTGVAPGGGIATKVTYEMRLAANDAGALAASNDAAYVTRAVTIAGPTMGGILRAGVAAGSRLLPWVGAALTAYQIYKWYTDPVSGQLMQPGQTVPSLACAGGPYFASVGAFGGNGCSVPGLMLQEKQTILQARAYESPFNIQLTGCVPSSVDSSCQSTGTYQTLRFGHPAITRTFDTSVYWYPSGGPTTPDPSYTTDPAPVSDGQLSDLVDQNPDWWPQMLTDPNTGASIITPEIAHDMDALKQQLAPRYGVDPTTLPQTQPDPDYVHGNATPREQSLPDYCMWASSACNYYKFVEDHWPNKDPQYTDSACGSVGAPSAPPACSGDVVMCAVARNTWAAKCGVSGDGSQPPDGGKHLVGELDSPDQTVGDTSQLDMSGFGFGTSCPFNSTDVPLGESGSFHADVGPVCTYGPWFRILLLALTAWKCAEIIGGVRSNK